MPHIICRKCSKGFDHNKRGRPPTVCLKCKGEDFEPSTTETNKTSSVITEVKIAPLISTVFKKVVKEDIEEKPKSVELYDYSVVVSNMGFAYKGNDLKEATKNYNAYVQKSLRGYGQVGFERVRLYFKDEIVKEFSGKPEDIKDVMITETG